MLYSLSYQSKVEPSFQTVNKTRIQNSGIRLNGAASTGFIQMAHNLESEPLYVHTYTAALKMAEEVRLELTRPLLNPRFSRPLPLDRLGLLFQNCGAGIGNRNRVNSLEGCVAASAYPQNRFFNLSNLLQTGCGGWTRTSDLQLMRLESYLCYTPLLWGADELGSRSSAIDCQNKWQHNRQSTVA